MFNCVGYFNYRQGQFDVLFCDLTLCIEYSSSCCLLLHRYFFNFLWFVSVALWYGAALCFPAFVKLGGNEYRDQVRRANEGFKTPVKGLVVRHIQSNPFIPTPSERTPISLGFMLCLCLAVAVTCLGGFHLYLVLSAQSTIEFHGNFPKKRKARWKNPYSAGSWKRNWEMTYGTLYWSRHSTDDSCESDDEDKYSYRGCWGVLMAMMPSKREPEFLPFPINGRLIRRRKKPLNGGGKDLEMASSELITTIKSANILPEETEFVIDSKPTNELVVGRPRANKSSNGG